MKWVTTHRPPGGLVAALDFETTGLDAEDERIVQIGLVVSKRFSVIDRWSVLVNPEGRPLTRKAADINGFTDEQLALQPFKFADLADELEKRTANALIVAHRLPFEVQFWAAECRRAGRKPPLRAGLCTRLLGHVATDGYKAYLQGVIEYLGVDCSDLDLDAHDALQDAEASLRIYEYVLRDMGWRSALRERHDTNIHDDVFDYLETNTKAEIDIYKAAKRGTLSDLNVLSEQ